MFDISEIKKSYPYLTELHTHTAPVSTCSHFKVDEIVPAYLEAGAHSLTITNHLKMIPNDPATPEEAAEYYLTDYFDACRCAEGTPLNILLGAELRFEGSSNDYLLYGICPDDIPQIVSLLPLGLEGFYRAFKNDRNLLLQAHPFRKHITLAPLEYLDGIEAYNLHVDHNSMIGYAAQYARDNDLIVSGGSDCHKLGQHALCLTRTRTLMRDSYDVAEALRSRDICFDISGGILFPYA